MILIPNYYNLAHYRIIFDYLGKPYGLQSEYDDIKVLSDGFAAPWFDFINRNFPELPVKPHRMMYAINSQCRS